MAPTDGIRSELFPATEKKHGEKYAFWLKHLKDLGFLASGIEGAGPRRLLPGTPRPDRT